MKTSGVETYLATMSALPLFCLHTVYAIEPVLSNTLAVGTTNDSPRLKLVWFLLKNKSANK